ncbi:MAG: sigma-70 family RNA polymerase sigma factor [Clostridium tyrobutyricum]|jgi:RNA polymerase sporulation-specific sigma factor|uniref:sigma-70 family RNA polymerase sigma factor n=1 Tax=Clostridium tyrobutyricum TaxID=1519 RepID=UPI00242C521F|nr:sigma-70 family RNA polymerase sigma factor [Clostridium tyrobutyricum]MCH4201251.1 sigma-70 family RNA polymerase sigma factor [Clostridium tyrobutyricum]MCH4237520.1 sigma-70 family RNA polymerase sigma factor [Clostridium tyrobutyricum]MCH4259311.1 sigma-70 family RNA polymerase sigma factor [Clostridium tyrobutyricum]
METFEVLVENNMGLVAKISKNFSEFGYDDIFQVGCIGLIKAAKSFKKNKNSKFSSYAYISIKGEICNFLRKYEHINLPCDLKNKMLKINKTKRVLEDNVGADVSFKDIAVFLGLSVSDVEDVISISDRLKLLSLDYTIEDEIMSCKDIISNNFNLEEYVSCKLDLIEYIHKLPKKYQKVVSLRLKGFKQREIAEFMDVSQVTISRYWNESSKKLKMLMKQNKEAG